MIIKKIKLENIRSYENTEVEFPSGSIVLAGDIGSGKTSILLGIEFALFGLQPGQNVECRSCSTVTVGFRASVSGKRRSCR